MSHVINQSTLGLTGQALGDDSHTHNTGKGNVNPVENGEGAQAAAVQNFWCGTSISNAPEVETLLVMWHFTVEACL